MITEPTHPSEEEIMTPTDPMPTWLLVHAALNFDRDTFASFADALGSRVTFDGGAS